MAAEVKMTRAGDAIRQQIEDLRINFTSIETRQINSVLDECVYKMDVLSMLPHELVHPEQVSQSLGDDVLACLAEHVRLCESYRATKELEPETIEMDQAGVARGIQNSLLNFLRITRSYGTMALVEAALHGAGRTPEEDQKAIQVLREALRELRGIVSEKLGTTSTEEQEHKRYAQEVMMRYQKNQQLINKLEMKVEQAEKETDKEISRMDEKIRSLKSSLQETEESAEDFVMHKELESTKQNQKDHEKSQEKHRHLKQEAGQLRVQLTNLITEHREAQKKMREKKHKLEADVLNSIQIYDKDMEEKQEELENLIESHEEDQEEFSDLQERYYSSYPEYCDIIEERARLKEQREEEERERRRRNWAAILIQCFWRRWRIARAMNKKSRPGSKKGKKGKTGKTGKKKK